jgi:hypothetical protein
LGEAVGQVVRFTRLFVDSSLADRVERRLREELARESE